MLPIGFFIHKSFTRSLGFVRILHVFMRSIIQRKKKKMMKKLQLQMLQSRFQSQHLAEQLSRFIGFIASVNGTNALHWWPNKVNGCQWQRSLHNMTRMTVKLSLNANTHTDRDTPTHRACNLKASQMTAYA